MQNIWKIPKIHRHCTKLNLKLLTKKRWKSCINHAFLLSNSWRKYAKIHRERVKNSIGRIAQKMWKATTQNHNGRTRTHQNVTRKVEKIYQNQRKSAKSWKNHEFASRKSQRYTDNAPKHVRKLKNHQKSQRYTENARKTDDFSKNPVPEPRKIARNRGFWRKIMKIGCKKSQLHNENATKVQKKCSPIRPYRRKSAKSWKNHEFASRKSQRYTDNAPKHARKLKNHQKNRKDSPRTLEKTDDFSKNPVPEPRKIARNRGFCSGLRYRTIFEHHLNIFEY